MKTLSLLLLLLQCVRRAASQATPTPTAAVPVDSTADFACTQPVRGALFWGKYNSAGSWSQFSTCNSADAQGSGLSWWEPSTSGSYCHLRSGGGQTNAPTLCSGSTWGYCAPAVRFVTDRAYSQLMATAQFCAGAGCGSIVVAKLSYWPSGLSGPSATLWAANTSGLAAVGPF
jgi:hypothetical protein